MVPHVDAVVPKYRDHLRPNARAPQCRIHVDRTCKENWTAWVLYNSDGFDRGPKNPLDHPCASLSTNSTPLVFPVESEHPIRGILEFVELPRFCCWSSSSEEMLSTSFCCRPSRGSRWCVSSKY